MKKIAGELQHIIHDYLPQLQKVADDTFSFKPNPAKWSRKEILGHLIDSAQNNIRRFIVAQYEDQPMIVYRQDDWVRISAYQEYSPQVLIELWRVLNAHACHILENTAPGKEQRPCITDDSKPYSIERLASDYVKHLLHHLHQILDLEPVPYP